MIHGAVFTKAVFISHDRHFMLFHQLVGQQGNHSLGSAQIKDTITNGTVPLSDEDWRFLENHNVNVGFSIDGYKELHDKNRGNSFDKAMHNVAEYKRVTGHYPTFNATVGEDD